ncbi:MAG: aminoacyl-histidine dipeptidase [Acidobacteria bacterium]|nr:aminoacyl-histidine dipeptidase [Acidobacteriota bacterium]
MSSPLQGLEPRYVWQHFDAIRQIPRPSKHEEKIASHIVEWARSKGYGVTRDPAGNVIVKVPATPGHEQAPVVILQGHIDMVCEKNSGVEHDFMKDPIEVKVDGDWVYSVGTTLGADNGIGVATAMAIADDPESVHGPLELLCTVDEETGLTGAMQLDGSMLSGRIMLNLDTEEDGSVYIGCAGGADSIAELPISRRKALMGSAPLRVTIHGLRGGHSGVDILENRANAIKLLARLLLAAMAEDLELDVVSMAGGSKHNAIPREAHAVIRLPKASIEAFRGVVERQKTGFMEEFAAIDPGLTIEVTEIDDSDPYANPLNIPSRDHLLHALNGIPYGVLAMSREVPGLVETSNNLAVVETNDTAATIVTSHRSSVMPALFSVQEQVRSVCVLAGASVEVHDAYPGWKPNPDSAIVKKTVEVYEELFGKAPELKAIHAGLECGLLLEKIPDMDVVSIGPEIQNVHSPDERVQVSSVQRFYRHVKEVLKQLA